MKTRLSLLFGLFFCLVSVLLQSGLQAQGGGDVLSVKFEELTTPEYIKAVEQSGGTCIIPLGIMEKHGAHLPLGTDLFIARHMAMSAAKKEYSVVFPEYYVGQIFEARHQPGTMAYSHETMWALLEETCSELARNGMNKIILVNGHGGNNSFLPYFCQSQLAKERDYCVILFSPDEDPEVMEKVEALRKIAADGHGGDLETGMMQVIRPDLVHAERAGEQSGEDQERLTAIPNAYTGIWWYAKYPNHYAGDASIPSKEAAAMLLEHRAALLADLIRILKQNDDILELHNRFFREAGQPLNTEQ